MAPPALEIADIFRDYGPAWRKANAGHVSLGQLKVMSAIESCRTAALGGHVERGGECAHTPIAYNSFQNKAVVYDLLFKASAETMLTIAGDPKHLGARIGITSVLHTWGSTLTHHPHVHMIVPGGGIALDGSQWVSCRSRFFLPWRVLAKLFRRLMLEKLVAAHAAGQLQFFGQHSQLAERAAFIALLAPLRKIRWYVYGKRPFAGPEAVLAYLARYTHRVAIANSRLIAFDKNTVSFKYKDYRLEGPDRYKTMTLATNEFIRRFLIHVLPKGLHRIRHYGLFAKAACADNIDRARQLLGSQKSQRQAADTDHHRGLRARRNATASAVISNHRSQDRYLMSAIAQAQRSKDAELRRWSSTGHREARPNQQPMHQRDLQSLPSAPVIRHQTGKLSRSKATNHREKSRQAP